MMFGVDKDNLVSLRTLEMITWHHKKNYFMMMVSLNALFGAVEAGALFSLVFRLKYDKFYRNSLVRATLHSVKIKVLFILG